MAQISYNSHWNLATKEEVSDLVYESLLRAPDSIGAYESQAARVRNLAFAIAQLVDMLAAAGMISAEQVVSIIEKLAKEDTKMIASCELHFTEDNK